MTVMKQKPSIQNTMLFFLIIIAVFSTGIYSFMWIYQEYSQFKNESAVVKEEFLNSNKARVKNEVERAVKYVEYKKSQTETRLKESIKARVYEAYNIATNIYNKNHGRKSDDEIKKMIKEALQSIIFNSGRGYFFATNFDGISELFADHPALEGTSMMNVKDTNGQFVIQDLIQIAKDSGEGFYRYTWTKPNVEGKDFPKIAFIKHFAPYDWFIGTGEYLDDVEKDIKQEIIQWLETQLDSAITTYYLPVLGKVSVFLVEGRKNIEEEVYITLPISKAKNSFRNSFSMQKKVEASQATL